MRDNRVRIKIDENNVFAAKKAKNKWNESKVTGFDKPNERMRDNRVRIKIVENNAAAAENKCIENTDTGHDVSVQDNKVTIKVVTA